MTLPKELTTVTPLSKAIALIMFISLPVIAFFFGMQYQIMLLEQSKVTVPTPQLSPTPVLIACTMDAKICPDGSTVGRVAPDCEFEECPLNPLDELRFCGGIANVKCPDGYSCEYQGKYPDAGGTCIQDREPKKYICPSSGYVNCMPGVGMKNAQCSQAFLKWAKANCPSFKGAAY